MLRMCGDSGPSRATSYGLKYFVLIDRSVTVCLRSMLQAVVSTLLEAEVGPFELLNVRQVLTLCPKSEVTVKV